MPNICCFSFKLKAPSMEAVKLLQEWGASHYSYERWEYDESENNWYAFVSDDKGIRKITSPVKQEDKCLFCGIMDSNGNLVKETAHHLGYRTFSFELNDDITLEGGFYYASGYGDCAWSLNSCWIDGGIGCYMSDRNPKPECERAISINDACKELGIEFECFSEEPGMGFSEHFHVMPDGSFTDDCRDLQEIWELDNYDSYEEWLSKVPDNYSGETAAFIKEHITEDIWKGAEGTLYIVNGKLVDCLDDYQYL